MWTNQKYDRHVYNERVAESTGPLLYRLNPEQMSTCRPCEKPYGSVPSRRTVYSGAGGLASKSSIGRITDVESLLLQQSSGAKGDIGRDDVFPVPNAVAADSGDRGVVPNLPVCNWSSVSENSLLDLPKQYFREMDAQLPRIFQREHVATDYMDPRYAIDTRLAAKDSYVRRDPKPLDQNPRIRAAERQQQRYCDNN